MKRVCVRALAPAGALVLLCGCGDRQEGARDELSEAGYAMTAEDFLRAAGADDTAVLQRFVQGGFDPATRGPGGDSALHVAAAVGAVKSLEFLLDRGLDVDLPGAGDRTPLIAAAVSGREGSVRYLLRQGADPDRRDADGYKPLMRAVEAGQVGVVEELAPYVRGDLDTALLVAAVLGKPEMIDVLTNYGASVYARTDDGRTALMVAAEHGHLGTARMLVEIGANRFAVDAEGRTAADFAAAAGHSELAAELWRPVGEDEFGLEPPELLADRMAAVLDGPAAAGTAAPAEDAGGQPETAGEAGAQGAGEVPWTRPRSGEGADPGLVAEGEPPVGPEGADRAEVAGGPAPAAVAPIEGATVSLRPVASPGGVPAPAIVMRHYRESALPLRVESVEPGRARVRLLAGENREVALAEGSPVPGSRLRVVRIERRFDHSKLDDGRPTDVSIVEVEDTGSGRRRRLVSGLTATAHDPLALVEDESTGRRFVVEPGDRFRCDDGSEFSVIDVRPSQLVLEHRESGETMTLPLRGPRG